MSDGFNCTKCGEYANPTVYRPGTPERLRMEATRKCRDCSAGDVLGTDDELPGILDSWDAQERLTAWRDAAVARHLAEAGAVHPAVHTPTRVMQWLGERGWQAAAPTDPSRSIAEWVHAESGESVLICLFADSVNYTGYAAFAIAGAAGSANLTIPEALLEIASMSNEVAW